MAKSSAVKSRALSLHIGLNEVDPDHYEGWRGELVACEFDANDMAAIAKTQEMKPSVLLTKKATRANVLKGLRSASKTLGSGDLFFVTYSGHGGQMPDVTGEEDDKKDETWCLYDGELIDDELYAELGRFAAGVRVLVLSDSCHSGTVVRARVPETVASAFGRSKMMPRAVATRTYIAHKRFYDGLQKDIADETGTTRDIDPDAALALVHAGASTRLTRIAARTKAGIILISGCQDNQTSLDGDQNGAFTEQLLRVWDDGQFSGRGTYVTFHAAIKAGMPASQTPNFFTLGPVGPFMKQRPFSV